MKYLFWTANSGEQLPPSTNSQCHSTSRFRSSFIVISFVVVFALCFSICEGKPDSEYDDFWKQIKSSTFNPSDLDKEDQETMDSIISIIIGVTVFIIVAIFAFILCLCCPLCLLAKMRGRRRGVVYRSAVTNNGTTITTAQNNRGATTVTVSAPSRSAPPAQNHMTGVTTTSPSVIAISNNANQPNKPYPVQQSVTVVPLLTPQQQHMNHPAPMSVQGFSQQYPYHTTTPVQQAPPTHNNNEGYPTDLPPAYPGLPREMDANNLPYNPYFSEDGPPASAPQYKQ